jgi:hypothetical protein
MTERCDGLAAWARPDLPLWVRVAVLERELAAAREQAEFVRGWIYGARGEGSAAWQSGWGAGFEAGWLAGVDAGRWRTQQHWLNEIRDERKSPASADWLARFGLEGRSRDRGQDTQGTPAT